MIIRNEKVYLLDLWIGSVKRIKMQNADGLAEISDELIHGDFVLIWYTRDGLPYCPTRLIAMVHYLRGVRARFINTQERLVTLTNILNHRAVNPRRKALIREALVQLFGNPGNLSVEFYPRGDLVHLKLLVFRFDRCLSRLEGL
jgi:hypothetical protein